MYTKNITLKTAENLISKFINAGGDFYQLEDGGVGLGLVVLDGRGHGLRSFVIEEYYLSEWASGHRLKIYTHGELPRKYVDAIEAL